MWEIAPYQNRCVNSLEDLKLRFWTSFCMLRATGTTRRISVATPLGCLYLDHAFENSTYLFFPFQGKILQFQKVMEKGSLPYFLYSFPIASTEGFWSSSTIPMYAWTVCTTVSQPIWLLEHRSTKKKKIKTIFHVICNGLTKKNAFSLCIHTGTPHYN